VAQFFIHQVHGKEEGEEFLDHADVTGATTQSLDKLERSLSTAVMRLGINLAQYASSSVLNGLVTTIKELLNSAQDSTDTSLIGC
jgi:hypothetical protein